MTFVASGLYDALKSDSKMEVLDTFDKNLSPEESLERRRQSLLVDLFITGTNAVTETGELVNLDMIGNRVGGITFGPKNVVILVGRNKVVADLEAAMSRIKEYVAPINAMRLDTKRRHVPKPAFARSARVRTASAIIGLSPRNPFQRHVSRWF